MEITYLSFAFPTSITRCNSSLTIALQIALYTYVIATYTRTEMCFFVSIHSIVLIKFARTFCLTKTKVVQPVSISARQWPISDHYFKQCQLQKCTEVISIVVTASLRLTFQFVLCKSKLFSVHTCIHTHTLEPWKRSHPMDDVLVEEFT